MLTVYRKSPLERLGLFGDTKAQGNYPPVTTGGWFIFGWNFRRYSQNRAGDPCLTGIQGGIILIGMF